MNFPHIAAVVAIPIAALVASAACLAKVSTSTLLCFSQSERAMSPHVAADLDRFRERSKDLGPVVALFVVTIAAPNSEPEEFSAARAHNLLAYLASHGFRSEHSDVLRIGASASDMGCAAAQIAVQIEALFPHDGYR